MNRRLRRVLWCITVLALAASCNKGNQSSAPKGDAGRVLAQVGKRTFTEKELDAVIKSMPESQQEQFSGGRGRLRVLNELVNRELLLQAALRDGLDKKPEVRKQLDDTRSAILMQAYQHNLVESQPKPTEAQIKAYYDAHPKEFVTLARVNASWIKCATKKEAEAARRRVVERGEAFAEVARKVSIDKETAQDGGLLGYFNPTGYVRGIGANRPEFATMAFKLEPGEVGPIFAWDGAWAFLTVHEKTDERPQPYESVRDRIASRLTPSFSDSLMNRELAKLHDQLGAKVFFDPSSDLGEKSADDLMRMATEAQNPNDKIDYYRALLKKYPHYERGDEAQFMIGFVYSEELQDFGAAKAEYEKVVQNYPNSDIKESANYMLQNMGQHNKLPPFEGGRSLGKPAGKPEQATPARGGTP